MKHLVQEGSVDLITLGSALVHAALLLARLRERWQTSRWRETLMDDSSKLLLTNSLMLDAVVELLIEKGVVSREEILEKVKTVRNAEMPFSRLIQ